jgi:hypothetical protein
VIYNCIMEDDDFIDLSNFLSPDKMKSDRMMLRSHRHIDEWANGKPFFEAIGLDYDLVESNEKDPPDLIFRPNADKIIGIEIVRVGNEEEIANKRKKVSRLVIKHKNLTPSVQALKMPRLNHDLHKLDSEVHAGEFWDKEYFHCELKKAIGKKEKHKNLETVAENYSELWLFIDGVRNIPTAIYVNEYLKGTSFTSQRFKQIWLKLPYERVDMLTEPYDPIYRLV